ncbi:NADH-quinone oxidoreductase subunit H [Phycisphaerales bacterium AB-hyl4]|uniref:NADH-quinone oxidoreductase subunit H n=1 Tax=Natronomicrosphaera hydrolytica TaxID=3242702 RepID=A0ABV4U9X8_9BACT
MSAQFFVSIVTITIVVHVILIACAYLIFAERKVAAWTQDRIGPNRTNLSFGLHDIWDRVGLGGIMRRMHWGLGQALADGLKLLVKEDYNPPHVDKVLFFLAPALAVVPALIAWAVIPWGGVYYFPGLTLPILGEIEAGLVSVTVAPINIGVVFILAISSLAVYGVVLAGYASNNKYSFLGSLRATAQMLSYEIPMGAIVLIMILTYATTDAGLMTNLQGTGTWGIFLHPLLAILFFVCILAETNRAPFDLAEAEQELVGGFHTEYSSMKWALFFLAEYMHMVTGCAFFVLLFLGGWDLLPFMAVLPVVTESIFVVLLKAGVFAGKIFLLLMVMMWIRWTLPRLRFDQLMTLAWRALIPMVIIMLLLTGALVFANNTMADGLPLFGLWLFVANVVVGLATMFLGPKLPQGPSMNRRVRLEGSRFYPPLPESDETSAERETMASV